MVQCCGRGSWEVTQEKEGHRGRLGPDHEGKGCYRSGRKL